MRYILNFFLLFLATLEQDIKKEEKNKPKSEEERIIEVKFEELQKRRMPYQKIPDPSLGGRVKSAFKNIGKVAVNVYDNTIGYGIAKSQDYRSEKFIKKNPKTKKKIAYLMPGWSENIGSQHRFAGQLWKEGYLTKHLKGNHHLPTKESSEKGFEQVDKFQKKTNLYDSSKRDDVLTTHSSASNVGIYMSGDKRLKDYGIKEVQARAPAPYGLKPRTWPQKLLMPFVSRENIDKKVAREMAVEMDAIDPKVNIHVVAGKYDRLVTPRDAAYKKHPKVKHYMIEHEDSTHFGTSGGNRNMNEIFIDLLKKGKEKYQKKYYKKAA